jgi:hypothetical protein
MAMINEYLSPRARSVARSTNSSGFFDDNEVDFLVKRRQQINDENRLISNDVNIYKDLVIPSVATSYVPSAAFSDSDDPSDSIIETSEKIVNMSIETFTDIEQGFVVTSDAVVTSDIVVTSSKRSQNLLVELFGLVFFEIGYLLFDMTGGSFYRYSQRIRLRLSKLF